MQKIIAANWKMFKTRAEAARTAREMRAALIHREDRGVIIFAPFTAIAQVANALDGAPTMAAGGQNVYPAQDGAFTGEVSPLMLRDAGAAWVLVGHSERRHILGESLDFIAHKTAFALAQGLKVMLCIGETLAEREAGNLESVLKQHLHTALAHVQRPVSTDTLAVAYEPVWAIGTGKVAGPAEIVAAHALCRSLLGQCLGESVAKRIPLLYGGSVKADNAPTIMTLDNVDGVLVGGASLQAETFVRIATA